MSKNGPYVSMLKSGNRILDQIRTQVSPNMFLLFFCRRVTLLYVKNGLSLIPEGLSLITEGLSLIHEGLCFITEGTSLITEGHYLLSLMAYVLSLRAHLLSLSHTRSTHQVS